MEYTEETGGYYKVTALVESITFHNAVTGFTVVEMNADNDIFTAVGVLPEVAPGEELTMVGSWSSHNLFGRQFKVESFSRSLPDTSAKLFHYLASGAIRGVGPKLALKIVEHFGERSFDVLENRPDELAVLRGISKEKAKEISKEFNRQFAMRKVLIELEEFGITPAESTAVYKYFGVGVMQTIRENPYVLCSMPRGFTFDRVEEITARMELQPKSIYRNTAGILHVVRHNLYNNGHTCIPRSKLIVPCSALLAMDETDTEDAIDTLLSGNLLVSEVFDGEEFIFLPDVFNAEMKIAERLHTILRFPPASIPTLEDEINKSEERNGIFYARYQRDAVRIACEKGMLILTGGPGTGKTTAVRAIIDVLEQQGLTVLLAAPTGRAAKRMTEVTGREAKTIHRLLEVEWDENDKATFRRDMHDPLEAGAVVIDEMSMVDCVLFAALLDALPFGCRVILVGDSDQLPSVGPGNVLGDLIASDVMPVVCLTEIFRQAQQSLIVTNAHRIISGELPELNTRNSDFFFLERNDGDSVAWVVAELVAKRLPNAYGFSPIDDIQVLCPSKKGNCGTQTLNRILQGLLNPKKQTKNEVNTPGGRVFREGDKVMQIRNNYSINWMRDGETGQGIFNGDVGILEKINYAGGVMTIRFDDRVAEYSTENLSELELAYAVTVHKSQGSEYACVVLPVSDVPPQLRYRNLLYTGVTRAKKLEVVVGSRCLLTEITQNNRRNRRYTGLKHFLTLK